MIRRQDLFQGSVIVVFVVGGALAGVCLVGSTMDWPAWWAANAGTRPAMLEIAAGAFAGGIAGMVIGAIISGLFLMLIPLICFRNPFYVMSNSVMTGHEHVRTQIYGRSAVAKILCLISIGSVVVWLMNLVSPAAPLATLAGALLCLPIVLSVLRPKCPYCQESLVLDRSGTYAGEVCPRCRKSFCEPVSHAAS